MLLVFLYVLLYLLEMAQPVCCINVKCKEYIVER